MSSHYSSSDVNALPRQTRSSWLFRRPIAVGTPLQVLAWWEVRRPLANVVVVPATWLLLAAHALFMDLQNGLEPGEDAVEPLLLLALPVLFNLLYVSGWLLELTFRLFAPVRSWREGPSLLKFGLCLWLSLVAVVPLLSLASLLIPGK